jgi:hypothetical protein
LILALVLFSPWSSSCHVEEGTDVVAISAHPDLAVTSDGWNLDFDRFLVVVGDIETQADYVEKWYGLDASNRHSRRVSGAFVFDLATARESIVVDEASLPPGRYGTVRYRVAPATSLLAGNVRPRDVAWMTEQGYSIYVEGRASRDGVSRRFAWGFDTDTQYTCYDRANLVLRADDLLKDEPTLLTIDPRGLFRNGRSFDFDRMAQADQDGDHRLSKDELSASRDFSGSNAWQVLLEGTRHIGGMNRDVRCGTAHNLTSGGDHVG